MCFGRSLYRWGCPQAFRIDPQRIERVFNTAKFRYIASSGVAIVPPTDMSDVSLLQGTIPVSEITAKPAAPPPPEPAATQSPQPTMEVSTTDHATANASADPMAALWSFKGHTLRELRCGNPSKKRNAPRDSDTGTPISIDHDQSTDHVAVDDEGYPILYGSCGRDKKYARCSVCYFRGSRCNTAHYCGCCQRPVCIRPRTYPGEELPKICWNVLHMDKDMIQRVDKRRARRLHAATVTSDKTMESDDDAVTTCSNAPPVHGGGDVLGSPPDDDARVAKQRRLEHAQVSSVVDAAVDTVPQDPVASEDVNGSESSSSRV